jgi:ribosome biogenesis GTPase
LDQALHPIGIVTRHDGPCYWAEVDGTEIVCVLRGRLKKDRRRVSSAVVVGDRVEVASLPDGSGVIEAVHPRRSELLRPGFKGLVHAIAANLDQLVIVQAARQPAFKRRLVERFVVTARRGRMEALVVVNKCDLEEEAVVRSWVAPLAATGVPILLASAVDGRGTDALRARLDGKSSVLAGQSGVGKSTLLNAMYPEFHARTSAVSDWSGKGRHTTTASQLYRLPGGGYLADTPGIRELGLFDDDEEAVTGVFPEILAAAPHCKFADCTHSHEPRCAVKSAVARGEIDTERYADYRRLMQGR